MLKRTINLLLFFLILLGSPIFVLSQPTWTFDPFGKEKKPEKFENKKLGSEKTADKKNTAVRNFYQNNITHYNYYFNANNRVNLVVENAKYSYKDDYSNLLSFYPFSLDETAAQKTQLDSVIYTSTAGILLHDLRNDWIDNMYMLIGKAYFLRKDFDSALMTFQFINYNLFPRKRKNDDDDRVVGTNDAASGTTISIANKENRNLLQKIYTEPPSRNDALLWLSRTLIEMEDFGESGGLINTLHNDPNLPKRLQNDLEQVNAYWFYKQGMYDSTATHLEKALSTADTKQDKSRWEFLLAQLFEMNHNYAKASDYYLSAAKHTIDPLMDIYARLNEAKLMKGIGDPKELQRGIDNLLKMARRDKYESYRDIIYYSAGQLALQKPDTAAAVAYFNKSLKYNENDIYYRNRSFLQLGNIAYDHKQYRLAAAMYDSLQTSPDSLFNLQIARIQERKNALIKISQAISNIEREDSLQHLASMQPAERDDYVKALVKKMRKEKGVKDDGNSNATDLSPFGDNTQQQQDLFAPNSDRGEWYFQNSTLRSRGFNEFKAKWGDRTNADNWRRKSAIELTITNPNQVTDNKNQKNAADSSKNTSTEPQEISYESLMKDIPLTEEKMTASNEAIASNMFDLAKLYVNELQEFQLAINTFEEYLQRFPTRLLDGEIYLGLYYCYTKLNNQAKADYYKNLLNSNFANSRAGQILSHPTPTNPRLKNPEATQFYENVYNLFIEGDFDKAIAEKKKADSLFGKNYWTPQLSYIEALHYVKQRDDSTAIKTLQAIITNDPNSPLKEKAETMIDVLKRRGEIEKYLTSLEVTRAEDDKPVKVDEKSKPVTPPPTAPPVKTDSVKKVVPPLSSGPFVMSVGSPHSVLMVLNKVDAVYVTEARNAFNRYNRENYYGQTINITKDVLDADNNLLVISSFPDAATALLYYDKIKRSAASEISWLPANKYSFLIITDENLQLLKTNKNISGYKALLNTQFPNRF